jgi:chemotaxis protein MotB
MADKTEESGQVRPIIVIKRKAAGHGGHHGGAWKVAYADFVTALMALFIVLWLMGQDKEIQKAIAMYFSTPAGPGQQVKFAIPSGPGKQAGTEAAGVGNAIEIPKEDMSKLREKIQEALKLVPNFLNLKDHIEITITADGLRIELLETEAGVFFESGKPVPTKGGSQLIGVLASELGKLPNGVMIEGHTDAKPYSSDGTYSNWDLSTDRANAARRIMEDSGLRANQVSQIRGFADRQLRHPTDPMTASNRRISVIVQYMPAPGDGDGTRHDASPPGGSVGGGTKPSAAAPPPGNAKPAK